MPPHFQRGGPYRDHSRLPQGPDSAGKELAGRLDSDCGTDRLRHAFDPRIGTASAAAASANCGRRQFRFRVLPVRLGVRCPNPRARSDREAESGRARPGAGSATRSQRRGARVHPLGAPGRPGRPRQGCDREIRFLPSTATRSDPWLRPAERPPPSRGRRHRAGDLARRSARASSTCRSVISGDIRSKRSLPELKKRPPGSAARPNTWAPTSGRFRAPGSAIPHHRRPAATGKRARLVRSLQLRSAGGRNRHRRRNGRRQRTAANGPPDRRAAARSGRRSRAK